MLLKKDITHHVLTNKLDLLALSVEVKGFLRKTLSSAAAYRSAMGEPYFDDQTGTIRDGKPSNLIDMTWRGTLGSLGKMCLEFVEAGWFANNLTVLHFNQFERPAGNRLAALPRT